MFKKLISFIFLALLISCQKDISVNPDTNYQGQLFIEGILYPGEIPRIFLSRALPFFNGEVTPSQLFARSAKASILHSGTESELVPDSLFDSFRCRWVPYFTGGSPVVLGESYQLKVQFEGKSYLAETTVSQPEINIDSVLYTPEFFDVYGGHDGVIVYFKDAPGRGDFYRFRMNRRIDNTRLHAHELDPVRSTCTNGEQFWVSDFGRTIFSDDKVDGRTMELYIEVSFEYLEGDTAWITMHNLDAASARFYQELDEQLQAIINPFVEPVFIDSHIGDAIGVFGSAVPSDSVLFIYPQDNP